jgi:ABC-type transport system substrate-binding protein
MRALTYRSAVSRPGECTHGDAPRPPIADVPNTKPALAKNGDDMRADVWQISRRWHVLAIAVPTVALLVVACGGGGSGKRPGQSAVNTSGTITIGTTIPAQGFNPATSVNVGAAYGEYQAIFDSLIQVNPKTGGLEPDLASAWAWSPNHLALTVTLRKGVRFQDGTPFNAAAVAYYENYYLAQGDNEGLLSSVRSVTTSGDYEVVFNLTQQNSLLPGNLSDAPGYIPSESALKNEGAGFATHPVGAGPYAFVSEEAGYDYVLKRWQGYWNNADEPRVSQLRWEVFSSDTAEVDAIESGAIDVAAFLAPQDSVSLRGNANLVVSTAPDVDAWFGFEDGNDPPFNSTQFRLAWEEAVNRDGMAKVVTDGTGTGFTVASPGVESYVKSLLPIWPYDPANAARLIKESGHPNGVDVTCYAEAEDLGGNFNAIDPILMADYKAVGINLTIRPMSSAQLGLMVQGKLGSCAFFYVDTVDTSIWGIENTFKNTSWSQGFTNPAHIDYGTDQYIDQFRQSFSNSALEKLYYEIEASQKADPPSFTPLFTAPEVNVYQKGIVGWYANAFNNDHWYAMYRTN